MDKLTTCLVMNTVGISGPFTRYNFRTFCYFLYACLHVRLLHIAWMMNTWSSSRYTSRRITTNGPSRVAQTTTRMSYIELEKTKEERDHMSSSSLHAYGTCSQASSPYLMVRWFVPCFYSRVAYNEFFSTMCCSLRCTFCWARIIGYISIFRAGDDIIEIFPILERYRYVFGGNT